MGEGAVSTPRFPLFAHRWPVDKPFHQECTLGGVLEYGSPAKAIILGIVQRSLTMAKASCKSTVHFSTLFSTTRTSFL
jgi:hypothetical protein